VTHLALLALALACAAPEPEPPAAPSDTDTDTDTAIPAPGTDTAAPTTTTVPPTPTAPCDDLPARGVFVAAHDWLPTFEDLTFDADGYAWGVSLYEGGLYRVPYGGPAELLRPGVSGYARGTRFLPDGRLASVDYPNNALLAIDVDTTAVTLLTAGLTSPNGLAIAEDGFLWLSQADGNVRRIDPVTGDAPIVLTSPVSNDGISFSPDYRTLYLNSDQTGDFLAVGVDATGAITSPLAPFATLPGPSDGMVVDACGNAYVTQFTPPSIVRVRPDGTVEPYIDLPDDQLIVAANFGTGVGGWTATHLFLSDWVGGLLEYDAGVSGKWEPHLP
jgi:sugar lactone lactonase YvrE